MDIANRSGTAARRPADLGNADLGNKALIQRRWQTSKSKKANGNEDDASHVNSGHLPRPAHTMLRRPSAVHPLFGGEKLSDVAVIDRAGHEIDMAAYELRDWTIIQALIRAADHGVKAHIYRDGVLADSKPLEAYLAKPGVEIRAKPSAATCPAAASPHTIRYMYMHLRPRARQLTQYVKRSSARVALVPSCGVEAALEPLIESGLGRTVREMAQAPASGLRGRLRAS